MHSLIQQEKLFLNKTLASVKTLKNRTECYYLYFYDTASSYNSIKNSSSDIFRNRYLFLDIDRCLYLMEVHK